MENIKFIRQITGFVNRNRTIVGDCVYYALNNGNRIKAFCEQGGVSLVVRNKINGDVDGVYLPFANYFTPKRCSPGAPSWNQHIDNGYWYFEKMYTHVLPTERDYINLANAIEDYIKMWEDE